MLSQPSRLLDPSRHLDAIIDNTEMALFVMDARQQCVFMNRAAETLTGYRLDEIKGRTLHEAVHHRHPDGRPYPIEDCPIDRAFPERNRVQGEEIFVHKDGHFYPVAFTASPIRNEAGEPVGTIIEARNVAAEHARDAAIGEAEDRYRLVAQATNDAIWDWDLATDHIRWNEAVQTLFGYAADSVGPNGRWWKDTIHPDDRGRVVESIQAVIDGVADSWNAEYRFRRADGSYADILDRGAVLRNGTGRACRMIGAMLDLSERKAVETALKESEARLQAIADSIDQMIWATRADGYHDYFNSRWYEFTGVPAGSTEGAGWNNIFHPEDRDRAWAVWQHSLETGEPYHIEYRLRHRSGEYRWVLGRAQPVRDAAGRITRWYGTCTDIHDLRVARDQLRAMTTTLEQRVAERTADRDRIWRLSTDLMLVAGFDATISAVNPAWTTLLGWSEEELIGRSFLDLVHPDDREATLAEAGRLSDGLTTLRFENRYRRRDGSYAWLSWTAVPDTQFIHAVARDIDAEKQAAEELARAQEALRQSQKMESVGQLTGGIAHDFNNLLTVVTGNIDMAKRALDAAGAPDPRARRALENAMKGAERAAALTQRLLAFSRRQPLAPKPLDVDKLVVGMSDLLNRALGETVQLEIVTSPGLWRVEADPNQLESAVLNLAVNARDAMPEGGQLTIETANARLDEEYSAQHAEVAPGQYVVIAVTDTGEGMGRETIERVFEPFFTTKEVGKGTGLGLSMVYGFVKQSGGHVKIYSELGHGTTVKIYLPRLMNDVGAAEETSLTSGLEVSREAETILVVEDDDDVRAYTVECLRELGYRVLEAHDGPSALRLLERQDRPIDLLFTDVVMPAMSGRELVEIARGRQPDLTVLYTSGYTRDAIVHGGRLDPGVEMIAKPFTYAALSQKVRDMLDRGRTGRVLVVEAEPTVRLLAMEALTAAGYATEEAATAGEALGKIRSAQGRYDVVLIDRNLGDRSGETLAAEVRALHQDLPILITAETGEAALRDAFAGDRCTGVIGKPYTGAKLADALRSVGVKCQRG
ncbi:PAS domain S-box protein [Sphingosinicella sp. BN140058]|uniref:hybrid sensor histidine kinase/response regulator n=1 Tax=Sphingosinicella sp. BN140058 TaxID=1892855 RepID=UPI00101257C6|nr:PAS domain S-box protein [Sphingosinicella sp. BN140058]QAY77352.1 PAS domain S-box protein [Sphingosinicella sp. BN140058]